MTIEYNENLIQKLLSEEIDISTFVNQYEPTRGAVSTFIINLMGKAIFNKNKDTIELLLIAADEDGLNTNYTSILCRLLKMDWLLCYESIVMSLDEIADPDSIQTLYEVALRTIPQDENSAFAKKCVWALKSIGTEESIKKIKLLFNETDSEILKEHIILNLKNV